MSRELYDIPNHEGYKITKNGNIWSNKSNKWLKLALHNGYLTWNKIAVHRLVAITFIPRVDGCDFVTHINGDLEDNRMENLKILCPNCHSQTPTFRNKKRPR